jgi:hypothetical protein
VTTFSDLLKKSGGARKPPRVVKLGIEAFAQTIDERIEGAIIGIRLISEEDVQQARAEAAQIAESLHPGPTITDDKVAAFNDALMRLAVARSACAPDDITQPFFAMGELEVRHKLTSETVRRLWWELDALHVASSPAIPIIDADGFAHLMAMWGRTDILEYMDRDEAIRVRRLLEAARQALAEAEETLERAGFSALTG